MKYIILIGDGMADRPLKELGGRTPLEVAFTPNMDRLARRGILGKARTIPEGFHPGSDVANMCILGYDPRNYYTGRAPFEAASLGIELNNEDVVYRCNLVTLKFDKERKHAVMEDYSAGHISTEEARELIESLNRELGNDKIQFYPGKSYRHIMLWRGGKVDIECVPPHDIMGKEITDFLPCGDGEEVLRELMEKSVEILESHPVNRKRTAEGKAPANSIWLWGQGKPPKLPTFKEKYGLTGALVSAVDLTKGIGIYAGFEILNVPGATGYIDTNYLGKAEYSLDALRRHDLVYLHVEAPDEAGHSGNYRIKIKAIEDFDSLVVGTILRGIKEFKEYRILLMPDHATPIEVRTHTTEPIPFVIYDNREERNNPVEGFSERITEKKDVLEFMKDCSLIDFFLALPEGSKKSLGGRP